MDELKELILSIRTRAYDGAPVNIDDEAEKIKSAVLSFLTDTEGVMTEEALSEISLTEDDVREFEQMATIGLEPDEHIEYNQRLQWLCNERLKKYTATRQNAITSARKDLEWQKKLAFELELEEKANDITSKQVDKRWQEKMKQERERIEELNKDVIVEGHPILYYLKGW